MKQTFVRTITGLIKAGTIAMTGARTAGNAIGVFHGSAEKFEIDLNALVAARDAYGAGCAILRSHRLVLGEKTSICREEIQLTRDVLKRYLGREYSSRWDMTNLIGSLGVSKIPTELLPVCDGLKWHLTHHPEQENPALNISAARMEVLHAELLAAITAVTSQAAAVEALLKTRNEKADRLYKRLRICVEELDLLIDPLDPRWNLFGFNKPGSDQTPDVPENIEVVVVNETTAMIEIPPSARAEHYRVYKRVVGVDEEPVAVGSPTDPNFTLDELPRRAKIEFYASAVNTGGESAMSLAVTVQTF